ncbi:MAG: magnesium chelatase ATPase subunit D, partial [Pseudomonadota bacterium]
VALDQTTDRAASEEDTDRAAKLLRASGQTVLFFDTSRRPSPRAHDLSRSIGAAYSPLPAARASQAVAGRVRDTIGRR